MDRHMELYVHNGSGCLPCAGLDSFQGLQTDTVSPCFFSSKVQSRSPSQAVDMWTSLFLPVDSKSPPELGGNPLPVFWTVKVEEGRGEVSWIAKWFLQNTTIVCRAFSQCRVGLFSSPFSLFYSPSAFPLQSCSKLLSRWCRHTAMYVVQMQSKPLEEGDSLHTKRWAAKLAGEALLKRRPSSWAAQGGATWAGGDAI